MTGKVVAVATLAALTGVLNLASMSITVLEGARLAAAGATLVAAVGATPAPRRCWSIPPAAFLFASVMVAIGALARSFKEAQTLLTPVYFLCMAPSLLAALGDFQLGGVAAFVPGVGVTLLARDLIAGHASRRRHRSPCSPAASRYGAAALALAAPPLRLRAPARRRRAGPRPARLAPPPRPRPATRRGARRRAHDDDAADRRPRARALRASACVLLLRVRPAAGAGGSRPGLALFEWVGLLGLTAIYARGSGRRSRAVLRAARARPRAAVAGAILIGSSAWLVIGLLAEWVLPPPKEVVESLRHVITPPEGRARLRAHAAADRAHAGDLRGGAVPRADPARPAHAASRRSARRS